MWLWILSAVSGLGLVGTIGAVIAVPSVAIPVLQKVVGAILKCKPCMALLAAIALLFAGALYGVHVEKQRSAAHIEKLRKQAAAAAVQRDGEVKADLERSFGPAMAANRALIKSLQDKVDEYANRKPTLAKPSAGKLAPVVRSCKLGDAAGLLRPPKAGRTAGAAKGTAADYLRRNFGDH